ncbi:MAG: hypothetical protein QOG62_2386 [Thermoleophilaceae bacterium]|jgi:hypothetical protein|nr:hypothetical protein [Thermoleophilaceae bacterium]
MSRFLFTTLQHIESDFYGRVGRELSELGHEVGHVTYSRRAAQTLERRGFRAWCLPDEMRRLGDGLNWTAEAERIAEQYDTPTFRDIYRTDFVCDKAREDWCVERTVRHVMAFERIFDIWDPEVVVPEVGNETIRRAAHLVGLRHGSPVLFLFYTIFPDPLRLYVDTMDAPIVEPDAVVELSPAERASVEEFASSFIARNKPIRDYRRAMPGLSQGRSLARHLAVSVLYDRGNEYLRPIQWTAGAIRDAVRALRARTQYQSPRSGRPYVYFPLHIVDDYKLKAVIPHCIDQLSIVKQVAQALPHGYDLVVKEHPMSVGRTPIRTLRELNRIGNVRLVGAKTSSHELIREACAVTVISSTVGLEALLHGKPVLTIGRPFYSGFGVTRDLDGPSGIREAVPRLLRDEPDRERILRFLHAARGRCLPGAPVLVDRSDQNARSLAHSLGRAAEELGTTRRDPAGVVSR